MIKYCAVAAALKAFSTTRQTRSIYRWLGNRLGGRSRELEDMSFYYYERAERNLKVFSRHCTSLKGRVVELGTGWVHWEALTMRLFFDFEAVLYDVWDNRQFEALKSFAGRFSERLGHDGYLADYDVAGAKRLIKEIGRMETFEQLYERLGFEYHLDEEGVMRKLPESSFRLAVSAGVMEHIPAGIADEWVQNMSGLLVEGGIGLHSINITDHLFLYDRTASPKQYMKYSDKVWRRFFENSLQYTNLIQRCEWLDMFDRAGLEVLEEGGAYADLSGLDLDSRFARLDPKDRDCTTLDLVTRKRPS